MHLNRAALNGEKTNKKKNNSYRVWGCVGLQAGSRVRGYCCDLRDDHSLGED